MQVARSQAAKILKRKPGTGATEEIPLTVFNIIEARGFPVKDRWEEPAFGRNATSLEGLHFLKTNIGRASGPGNSYSNHPFSGVFPPSLPRCKLNAPGHTASDSIHTRAIERRISSCHGPKKGRTFRGLGFRYHHVPWSFLKVSFCFCVCKWEIHPDGNF